jgi:hypothetical protein
MLMNLLKLVEPQQLFVRVLEPQIQKGRHPRLLLE